MWNNRDGEEMEAVSAPLIEWGVGARTLAGQSASGDRYLVKPFPCGVLVAVVDGLGHGVEAAMAASLAVRTLESHAEQSVILLMKGCHEKLRGTRGAVMSLASFSARDGTMTWLGVGNVEGLLVHRSDRGHEPSDSLLLRGGVVGTQLPALSAAVLPVRRGDILILASDGIRREFARTVITTDPTQKIADRILADHAKSADDALVLVSRYLGDEGATS
jgi:negative regulator of sigma-B (phosphoserine phosphatase)